jgi:dTDP-glucose 4,6-dehydratase/UDP-glucose 4-epimerase
MRILVMGSQGFIGNHCFNYFRNQGAEIWGADILQNPFHVQKNYHVLAPVNPDYDQLFSSGKFDICINASGSGNVGFSFENPEKDHELNAENVSRMLGAIKRHSAKCKFINFSSAAVYGNPVGLPVREDASTHPLSPYGTNKLESEQILHQFAMNDNLSTCSLRVFSAYGPGLRKQLFWDLNSKVKSKDSRIELFGTGKETRDFIFIDDLVCALDCVIHHAKFQGEKINVASGEEEEIAHVAGIFLSVLDCGKELIFNGIVKQGDPLFWKADITLLKSMGFAPKIKMTEGLQKYALWLKEESGLV